MALLLTAVATSAMVSVESPATCVQCAMDRTRCAYSRMVVAYTDGTVTGVCSLHCAVKEMQLHMSRQVRSLMVADYSDGKLVDAETATWVVGGRKNGVMRSVAKWAFGRAENAQRFVKENGGVVSSFNQAMEATLTETLNQDAEEQAIEEELNRALR